MANWETFRNVVVLANSTTIYDRLPLMLLDHFGLLALPVNSAQIARDLGIAIVSSEGVSDSEGGWWMRDGQPVMFLDTSETIERQRWLIARSIGQILIWHKPWTTNADGSVSPPPGWGDTNLCSAFVLFGALASRFADDLVMPTHWVKAYRQVSPNAPLAELFGVTELDMDRRLESLR